MNAEETKTALVGGSVCPWVIQGSDAAGIVSGNVRGQGEGPGVLDYIIVIPSCDIICSCGGWGGITE